MLRIYRGPRPWQRLLSLAAIVWLVTQIILALRGLRDYALLTAAVLFALLWLGLHLYWLVGINRRRELIELAVRRNCDFLAALGSPRSESDGEHRAQREGPGRTPGLLS